MAYEPFDNLHKFQVDVWGQIRLNDVGLGINWFDVTGSATTNQMTIPFNPTNGSVFYRLAYP